MGLAGRKIKQRIPKDPRNLTWADDAAKFGANYLAKFGWDTSKGLGVDGEGRTSHLKVSQKLDMMGIGAAHQRDPNGIAWKQNKDFENLLKRLNAQQDGSGDEEPEKEFLAGGWVKANEEKPEGNEAAQRGDEEVTSKRKKDKKRKAEESLNGEGEKQRKKRQKKHKEKEEQPEDKSEGKQKSKSTSSDEAVSSKKKSKRKETKEANSDSSSSSSEDGESTSKPSTIQTPTPALPRHRAHRARVIAAKRLASQSASAMSEILGIAVTPSSITPQAPQGTLTPITDDITIENLTTSTKSVADYFKEKLLAKPKTRSGTSTPTAGSTAAVANSGSSAVQEGDAGLVRTERENESYDDAPRIGLGGSRLRFAGLAQTSNMNEKSRGNDYAQDLGMSKFSSLMSSNFLHGLSTSPIHGTNQDTENKKNGGDTPDENASKKVKAGKEKKTKKGRTQALELNEADLPDSTDDQENKRKKKKKAKLGGPDEEPGASDDAQTASITPDSEEGQKETKGKRESDDSTEQQNLTSHAKGVHAEKTREDRKREKAMKKAERTNQVNEA